MPTRRYYANAAPQQTLQSGITSTATTLTIQGSFTGWPTQFPFFATLELGGSAAEIVSVTNISGTTATVTRAQGGTPAVSHTAGATFDCTYVAQDADEANAHTSANSGVHGVSGNVVGDADTQTLTNKTLTSPTINGGTLSSVTLSTPTVNTPTITNPTVSGAVTQNALNKGDTTHPALLGQATTTGGKTLSLVNASSQEKASADDAGNLTLSGSVTATKFIGTNGDVGYVQAAGAPGVVIAGVKSLTIVPGSGSQVAWSISGWASAPILSVTLVSTFAWICRIQSITATQVNVTVITNTGGNLPDNAAVTLHVIAAGQVSSSTPPTI